MAMSLVNGKPAQCYLVALLITAAVVALLHTIKADQYFQWRAHSGDIQGAFSTPFGLGYKHAQHFPAWEGNESASLLKRVDGAGEIDEYTYSVNTGQKLIQLMATPEKSLDDGLRTTWKSYNDISKFGWKRSTDKKKTAINSDETARIQPVISALHLPALADKQRPWVKVVWRHKEDGKYRGVTYAATGAEFINLFHPHAGIIVAADNTSPSHADHPPTQPLHHWSDIVALTWAEECRRAKAPVHGLRYVLRINIVNPQTQATLAHVLGGKALQDTLPPTFPAGQPVTMAEQSGQAQLGTPIGSGVAYLLIQHKHALGDVRGVRDVRVWNSNNGVMSGGGLEAFDRVPCMLFTLTS